MKSKLGNIIIIGNARDYHAMDWYRSVKAVCSSRNVLFATDLIDSEGHLNIVRADDNIIHLYNIDSLLFNKQSNVGNIWRNLVKFIVSPLQVSKLKDIKNQFPNSIFHAHTMYYMFLCWMARMDFIGTPQGSEVLVRPDRSFIYKYFACKALKSAKHVSVDSENMKNRIRDLCGREAIVIQNGIDAAAILSKETENVERTYITSFRNMHPLYRINEILRGRSDSTTKPPITFIYATWEEEYRNTIVSNLLHGDKDLGRLSKDKMYGLFLSTVLAISIPMSDSSPRSVYEAIFCGCCVAVTYNPWIDAIPDCMKARLFMVNLEDKLWFEKALDHAESVTKVPYVPSEAALELFDQRISMKIVAEKFY